jgi:hypothetical protein
VAAGRYGAGQDSLPLYPAPSHSTHPPAQISHGVIESSAQLAYTYSFGALNEATADIMSGEGGLGCVWGG